MRDAWDQALHGPTGTRIALWSTAIATAMFGFVLDLGWWSFMLRAGLVLFGAGWLAHWLTDHLQGDRVSRAVGWLLAGGVILLALIAIAVAAFDGEGSP